MKNFYSILLLALFGISILEAQWKTTPNEDNFISVAPANQFNPAIASDGNDGAFIVWEDNRNSSVTSNDIYIQRIDKDGNTLFSTDGIPVCTAQGHQRSPKIVEAEDGCVIVFWLDERINYTNSTDLYAQKIDANGNPLWTSDGVPVSEYTSPTPGGVDYFNVISDGNSGAFTVWQRDFSIANHIRAQRINSDGLLQWAATGVIVTDGPRMDRIPQLIRDNLNGGIVVAFRGTTGYSIMAQRISPSGELLWIQPGVIVTPNGPQNECSITAGDLYSNGGLMAVSWIHNDIVYAQLIDTIGNKLWGENGIIINNVASTSQLPKIENDFNEEILSPSQPGIIDSSFADNGFLINSVPNTSQYGNSVALQPDGKIVIGGTRTVNQAADDWFIVLRLNENGTLDNTFGTGGIIAHRVRNDNDRLYSIAIQSDGKIIAGGSSWYNGNSDACLVRYTTDGTIDTFFGNNGIVITQVSAGTDIINSIALQNDGKIVAVGSSDANGFIARYNIDGTLDSTFGSGGISASPIPNYDHFNSVQIQTDGKIIAAGDRLEQDFTLVRYLLDGNIDTTFGDSGYVITDINTKEICSEIILQDDGKILMGGSIELWGEYFIDCILLRYNSDGRLDQTFGTNGYTITHIDTSSGIGALVLQNDGKIIAGGRSGEVNKNSLLLLRYNTNGLLDSTFGVNGIIKTPPVDTTMLFSSISSLTLQGDGKIIGTGYFSRAADNGSLVVVRYLGGEKVVGNYYVSWFDTRPGVVKSIYIQKLNNGGLAQWTQNGKLISDKPAYGSDLNSHQLFFNRKDFLSFFETNEGIYAQSISSNGTLNWGSNGAHISQSWAPQTFVKSGSSSNNDGAILTFSGVGNPVGTGSNVYAKRINPDGTLGGIISSIGENNLNLTDFVLYQNYPNPFNPRTIISWQSPVSGHQTLKIYDVLGNEVAALVNEYKPAGTYEVDFNAQNLSSGVYFYTLQAGTYVHSKKMVLLK